MPSFSDDAAAATGKSKDTAALTESRRRAAAKAEWDSQRVARMLNGGGCGCPQCLSEDRALLWRRAWAPRYDGI